MFYFDARSGDWEQIWVTANTATLGGLKRKTLIERMEGGGARFQGELTSADDRPYFDRTTLSPLDKGAVCQLIEISTDGGNTWRTTFDARYARLAEEGG